MLVFLQDNKTGSTFLYKQNAHNFNGYGAYNMGYCFLDKEDLVHV